MKALFCTDGSNISYNALKNYFHFAPKDTVIDFICAIDWGFLPDNVIIEESGFVTSCRNIADDILIYTQNLITENGFEFGNRIKLCGSASEGILDTLDSQEYDIVILGSHGKKGLQKWLGSVSKDILDNAKIPVYISKNRKTQKRILFTVDTVLPATVLAEKFLAITDLSDAELNLLTVVENPDLLFADGKIDNNWLFSIKQKQELYAQKTLNEIRDFFRKNGIEINNSKILSGVPAQSIIDDTKEIDLIVMGSTHRNKNKRLFMNSVSKRVNENTNCDTLTIKI